MVKSYKYRIYPNKKQIELINKTFGCCRFVYNYYLNKRMEKYQSENKTMSFQECSKDLTSLKKELIWLKEPDKCSLQNTLKNLDNAYKKFYTEHSGFPKFKSKKSSCQSYTTNYTNNNIRYSNKKIRLPKIGEVRVRDNRSPDGKIINATISKESNGHYYCSICCDSVFVKEFSKTNKNIGIDLGIADFAIFSDGTKISNPKFYEQSEKKLAKLQRELSRKTRGGSNWNKARIKVAKLQEHIANQRKDFLHKLSTNIIKEYDIICIEDLDVKSMKETDRSTRNKRIGDVSFYEFRRQLTYKCKWYEKKLVVINRFYPSSQICNMCGNNAGKKHEDIRFWICPYCGEKLDRDINAAVNILHEGLRICN